MATSAGVEILSTPLVKTGNYSREGVMTEIESLRSQLTEAQAKCARLEGELAEAQRQFKELQETPMARPLIDNMRLKEENASLTAQLVEAQKAADINFKCYREQRAKLAVAVETLLAIRGVDRTAGEIYAEAEEPVSAMLAKSALAQINAKPAQPVERFPEERELP